MARLTLIVFLMLSLVACTQNSVKKIQTTLNTQVEADNFYAQGDCEQAIPLYRALSESMSSDTQSLLRIGNCYAKSNDFSRAEQAYQQALLRDNQFVKAWYNLAYVRAQILANTVSDMYKNVGSTSIESQKIRDLTVEVLAPFKIELDTSEHAE